MQDHFIFSFPQNIIHWYFIFHLTKHSLYAYTLSDIYIFGIIHS